LDLANDLRDLVIDYGGEAGSVAHLRKVVVDRLNLTRKALSEVLERARLEVAISKANVKASLVCCSFALAISMPYRTGVPS